MLVDISARKQAENEQRALINELNHRVKNTLATVQSIARQTFRTTPTPEQFISKLEGRLLALSKAHDLLTRRRWTGLEFGELLDAEFTPFTSPGSERIHLDGPEITLPPRVGLVLAMVVHELATNAAKYGALCRNEGHVYLRWRLTEREGAPRLQLQWREAHGPQVVTPLKRGFGSQIIERSITRDLGGEVRVDFDPAGLVCHAEFALGQ